MQLYPAIDIKGGQCVRLTQGLFDQAKVYAADPAEVAKLWKSQGATWLHLVDLDGALAGRSVNEDVIRRIVREVDPNAFFIVSEVSQILGEGFKSVSGDM